MKISKKIRRLRAGLMVCIILLLIAPPLAFASANTLPVDITVKSAILYDAASNTVICEKNADDTVASSGIFKTMSLLLFMEAIENGELGLDTMVSVSGEASKTGGMSAFLEANDSYSVETLLKSVAMISANDACIALAEHICGSQEVFVQRMNERAAELGLTNTRFTNATGISAPEQYTSARDMAAITCELIKYPKLLEYSKEYLDTIEHQGGRVSELTNPNRLVRFYPGCDGLQTGSNSEAGYCISATAQRNNQRLVCVVMGAQNNAGRSDAASKLLDYGFANFTSVLLVRKNDIIKKEIAVKDGTQSRINLIAAEEISLLLAKGEEKGISKEVEISQELIAPLEAGQKVGVIKFLREGEIIAQTDLVTDRASDKTSIAERFKRIVEIWLW